MKMKTKQIVTGNLCTLFKHAKFIGMRLCCILFKLKMEQKKQQLQMEMN